MRLLVSAIMRCAVVISLIVQTSGCSANKTTTRLRYPATRTVDVVDDYHGTKVADPYRWLEELESREVRDWAAAQTAIAVRELRQNEIRPWLLNRVAELQQFWHEPSTGPREPELIDEAALGAGKTVEGTWPSPDRAFAAYAVSDRGSEWVETRIRRLSDGKDLDDRLEGMLWSDASWTKDNRGFFYVRSLRPTLGERTTMKGPAVYYHVAGTPQSSDMAVHRIPQDVTDLALEHGMSDDGRYLFIYEGNGATVDGLGWLLTRMHMVDLGDPKRPALSNTVVPLTAARDAAYRVIASAGDTLYVFTDRDAPHRRVVAVDIANPAPEHWRDVVPETDDVIDEVYDIDGRFVVKYLRNVQHGVRVFDRSGRMVRELSIPPMTAVTSVRRGAGGDELVIEAMEGGFARTRTRYGVTTGAVVVERPAKRPFRAGEYEAKQVWYPSKDGVRVPMFVLHRRGLRLDGSHPMLLAGYGASSQLTLPWFGEWPVATLELGMVIAIPALRGGGEFGRAWYEAAILERKQTTFDDFIAAAEYLIEQGYTSPEKLAIQGASNGGLLVAAVVNQRPDLFRVAVAEVPMSDALRYDFGRHRMQFGDAKNPAQFPFLYRYSPQQNVKRACYPSMLITTALNDDRAPAWAVLKYTAALQAAQSCDRPIILRADSGGGHVGDALSDPADVVAFVARQLGLTVPSAAGGRE
jgi:prolyl oligopeptidase